MEMLENVILSNPKKLTKIKNRIARGGAGGIHVIADFDKTLTYAFVNGKKIPSVISLLRDENYLTEEYSIKAQGLYEKYHPLEIASDLSVDKKKKAMMEWWEEHFKLLIKFGLNKKDIKRAIMSERIKLREGASEFLDYLHSKEIPLIIFSSAGLGEDLISMFLEKEMKSYENIHIVSNSFKWDKNGYMIGIKEPIIHVMNKDETSMRDFPFYKRISKKENVILLGDSLGDVGMVKGFKYKNLIKIGFLNEDVQKNLRQYTANYDIVILNDSGMGYINNLIKEILNK